MKIIDSDNTGTHAKLNELKPFALEALEIINAEKLLVKKAQFLMKKSGASDVQMGQHPFAYCETLVVTYGQLSLEVEG